MPCCSLVCIYCLSTEPEPDQTLIQHAFRYLVYSHSQLSYISALGHQREQIQDQDILKLLDQSEILLNQTLIERQALPEKHIEEMFSEIDRLNSMAQVSEQQQLLLKQMMLLLETLPELVMLKNRLLELEIK